MTPEKKIFTAIVCIMGLILLYSNFSSLFFIVSRHLDMMLNWKIMLNVLPAIIGLAGVIIFAATKFKKDALLKIYMCFNILLFPFYLLGIKYSLTLSGGNLLRHGNFILSIILTLLLMACSCTGLWLLSRKSTPVLKYLTIGTESFAEFSPAPASLRFLNRFADLLIIVYLLYVNIIDNRYFRGMLRGSGAGTLFLIEFLLTIYYYLLLEGIFNTSIGKCITSTMIVDETGRKPGFGKIIGRTLCRYIPFEPFSFLGKEPRGWHDSMSGTYVVKTAGNEEEIKNYEL